MRWRPTGHERRTASRITASAAPPSRARRDEENQGKTFEEKVCEDAYVFGWLGEKLKRIFGGGKPLTDEIEAHTEARVKREEKKQEKRAAELEGALAATPVEVARAQQNVTAQDRRTAELEDEMRETERRKQGIEAEVAQLSPGERAGRRIGVEAVGAWVAAGVADTSAFILTINAVGGALWVRVALAGSIALALNAAVYALARTLAGAWRMMRGMRRRVLVALTGAVVGALALVIVAAFVAAGEFRAVAVDNLDKGLPTDPAFLVWTGLAGALGAVVSLGWWHYSSTGDRLAQRIEQLNANLTSLEIERQASIRLAREWTNRMADAVALAAKLRKELDALPAFYAKEVAAIRAEGHELEARARKAFKKGSDERKDEEGMRRRDPSVDLGFERRLDIELRKLLG
jgi:hypothetical protein